jgi:hypothetical protein
MRLWITLLLLTISSNLMAQNDKKAAEQFFKKVVKSYFDNCETVISYFDDSVTIVNPFIDTIFSREDLRINCFAISEFIKPIGTYKNYLKEYKLIVLNKKEFSTKTVQQIQKDSVSKKSEYGWVLSILRRFNSRYTKDDYVVFGDIPVNNVMAVNPDIFWKIVRKTKNGWRIVGASK